MDTIDQEDLDTLDINHSELKLPEDDTTYWCSVHKLPDTFINKHHAIQVKFHSYTTYSICCDGKRK